MEDARRDVEYLESVLEEIQLAETEQDFLDIRAELREAGFLRSQGKGKKEQKRTSRPWEFRTTAGLRVQVGRNNRQNDHLTMKEADHRDLWFHTQKNPRRPRDPPHGGRRANPESIREAAALAAWYSQARRAGTSPWTIHW